MAGALVGQERPDSRADDGRSRALSAIRAQVAQLESDLEHTSRRTGDLLGQAASTRAEVRLQEARLAEARAALELTRARVSSSQARVESLEMELKARRADLSQRLVVMSRAGGRGYLRLFLSVDREAELLPAVRLLRFLIRRDALAIEGYRSLQDDLLRITVELAREEQEAAGWLAAEQARSAELVSVQRRQRRLLSELEARRARLLEASGQLTRKEARLERLMEALADETANELQGVAIQEFQGALDWPAPGAVELEFGPRRDPTYRTTVPHNGIQLTTTAGDVVRVIYGGRVLFAAPFQDLGFTVVVEHAGRVLTLYAGLAEVLVEEGDVLALSRPIGVASSRLYFEIRVERQPQNPRDWLL